MRIIYIDIDSCRPDHLGCYGYSRRTSPVIDELAAGGARLENCHTSDAPCLPSRAALFSGLFGIHNGVVAHDGPGAMFRYYQSERGHGHDPDRKMWMRVLQEAGWETVCFSGFGQRHAAWWFHAGFTQDFGNQFQGANEQASDVSGKAIRWLQSNGAADNWFMHLNFWDAHHPYCAPQTYFDQMADQPGPAWPDAATIERHAHDWYGPRTARDWWFTQPGFRNRRQGLNARMPAGNPDNLENFMGFVNGHDAGIRFVDEQLGLILEQLDALGLRDEIAIIVSGDHGESVGELGMYWEHGNCCEGTTHIPMIVHWPGLADGGQVLAGLLYNVDLPPTVLELLGLPVPARWDGASFAAGLRGEQFPGRDHLVCGTGIFSYQRAVRTPQYRLIRTIHPGLYPYDPVYLFDMQADPHQQHDLSAERPDVLAELDHLLLDWQARHTTGVQRCSDPFQDQLNAGFDPDIYFSLARMEQRLIDVGRTDQLDDLRRRRTSPTRFVQGM